MWTEGNWPHTDQPSWHGYFQMLSCIPWCWGPGQHRSHPPCQWDSYHAIQDQQAAVTRAVNVTRLTHNAKHEQQYITVQNKFFCSSEIHASQNSSSWPSQAQPQRSSVQEMAPANLDFSLNVCDPWARLLARTRTKMSIKLHMKRKLTTTRR